MTLTVKWGDGNYSLRGAEQTLGDSCCLSFGLCNAETKSDVFLKGFKPFTPAGRSVPARYTCHRWVWV